MTEPRAASLPQASICVPVHNGERTLARTMRAILAQTAADYEVVVLDNASSDDTRRVAEEVVATSESSARVRIERNPHLLPLTDNWNRAVELCRAPLVKLVCADDLVHPRCLEAQVRVLSAEPGAALAVHRQHLIDAHDRVLGPARFLRGLLGTHDRSSVLRVIVRSGANPIGTPAGLTFRKAAFDASGGFRAHRPFLADLDLYVRLVEHGHLVGFRETLASFRITPGSVSSRAGVQEYAQQRQFCREVADSAPPGAIRRYDEVVGHLRGPLAAVRRQFLFAAGRLTTR